MRADKQTDRQTRWSQYLAPLPGQSNLSGYVIVCTCSWVNITQPDLLLPVIDLEPRTHIAETFVRLPTFNVRGRITISQSQTVACTVVPPSELCQHLLAILDRLRAYWTSRRRHLPAWAVSERKISRMLRQANHRRSSAG